MLPGTSISWMDLARTRKDSIKDFVWGNLLQARKMLWYNGTEKNLFKGILRTLEKF